MVYRLLISFLKGELSLGGGVCPVTERSLDRSKSYNLDDRNLGFLRLDTAVIFQKSYTPIFSQIFVKG